MHCFPFALFMSAFFAAEHEPCIFELALTRLVHVADTGMADDCALAGYFSRLLGILLSRSADQILGFLKASFFPPRPSPFHYPCVQQDSKQGGSATLSAYNTPLSRTGVFQTM